MNRRDTIIVAVLVNTGLLAVLFMMAMNTDVAETTVSHETDVIAEASEPREREEYREPLPPPKEEAPLAARDEVDEVLRNYSRNVSASESPEIVAEPEPLRPREEVSSEDNYVEVKVKKGDYLEKIARANGTTVSAIMRANSLRTPRIDVGQTLRIPLKEEKPAEQAPVNNEPEYYTVKSGDNPWKIAKQFRVRFDDLLKLNELDEPKARNLKPGDVLRVK